MGIYSLHCLQTNFVFNIQGKQLFNTVNILHRKFSLKQTKISRTIIVCAKQGKQNHKQSNKCRKVENQTETKKGAITITRVI